MDVTAAFRNYMSDKVNRVSNTKKADDNGGDVAILFGGRDTVNISPEAQELYEAMRRQEMEQKKEEQDTAQRQASQEIRQLMYTAEEDEALRAVEAEAFEKVIEEANAAQEAEKEPETDALGRGSAADEVEKIKAKMKILRQQIQQIASDEKMDPEVKQAKIGGLEAELSVLQSELAAAIARAEAEEAEKINEGKPSSEAA